MLNKAMFTSNSDEYPTPIDLFNELNNEFKFDLDPCATEENHKCDDYFTKSVDGLTQSWTGKRVFCNPPYSNIAKWVEKAYRETREDDTLVVLLIPARTDTKYFHNFIYQRCEIRFIKGRLRFSGDYSAPFPSMLCIFRGANLKQED